MSEDQLPVDETTVQPVLTDTPTTAGTDETAQPDDLEPAPDVTPIAEPVAEALPPTSPYADAVTIEEAQAIFDERRDVATVLTDQGYMNRDGTFYEVQVAQATGE